MERLFIQLRGRTPLLMNNPKETLAAGEEEGVKGKVKMPPPDEQAKMRRYLLPDGNLYIPAPAVRKCLITAARGYTAKGEIGRRQAVGPILSGALILIDPAFPLVDEKKHKPIPGDHYELDTQRVVIRAAKAAVWRGRPKIWPWFLECCFLFDSRRIGVDLVEKIARDAGYYPGLLDYRPEKGGWFGTFELVKIWTEPIEG